jgi:hypothetical protein
MHFLKLAGKKVEKEEKAVSFSGSHVLQGLAEAVPPFTTFSAFFGTVFEKCRCFWTKYPFPTFSCFLGTVFEKCCYLNEPPFLGRFWTIPRKRN